MTTPSVTPAGWYGDPQMPGTVRYFDGYSWTQHVSPAPIAPSTFLPAAQGAFDSHPPYRPASAGSDPSDPLHWLVPTGRTWQSIAAGYLALFAIVIWILGPFALGLGVWALKASDQNGAHGRGRAIFAIIVGGLATLAMLVTIANMAT